ncbi:protein lifeguard 1-like [Hydra vulgaris]|uniref:Protein lifeguard 1-like n=1 Tax=Hydra vulgaris TaxID=6087 RepID=A0ABM4CSS5_HYDVU
MSNQYSYSQHVNADLEANKPPPYTSYNAYATQENPMAPPPQYGWVNPDQGAEPNTTILGISSFSEKSIRQAFIRKVYAILFCQLLVSVGIVCLFLLVKPINTYVKSNVIMFWAAWILTLVLMIALVCCESVRRTFPMNFIMLSLFTLCESYLIGVVSAHYEVNEVLLAMGIVAILSLAITIFAFQTKYDFTMMGGFLLVLIIVLLCFGIFTIFFHSKIVRIVYACLGALVFGLFLVFDTQMMLGGKKKYSLSPEEYIFAALNLYIDIITLFLYILQIIGLARN